jgi:predicted DNA-binding protein (UPF0251 family)
MNRHQNRRRLGAILHVRQPAPPFVDSLNLKRRHLDESQRAMVAKELASLGRGRPGENPPIGGISQEEAAQLLNVGVRSVQRAAKVSREAPRSHRNQDANLHLDRQKAAELMQVSPRSVATAAKVSREAPEPVVEAVKAGTVTA